MGLIWFVTPAGKIFHLPVAGEDANSSATAFPVSIFGTQERALSGTITVELPGGGVAEVLLDPPGRTGSCNKCGQCCQHPAASCPAPDGNCGYVSDEALGIHRCAHLVIAGSLGSPGATACGVREDILSRHKGCAISPDRREPWMDRCSFRFEGE